MDNIIIPLPILASLITGLIVWIISLHNFRQKDKAEIKKLTESEKYAAESSRILSQEIDKLRKEHNELKSSIPTMVKQQREQAVTTSRAVLKGKISEEIVPLLPNFPYQLSDCKFFGSPIDFIIFDGMSNGEINNIIFLDVKTGGARLSTIQRKIRDAVKSGRVIWHTYVRE